MNHPTPECARLAAELRSLRQRSGLTLSALAAESAYSKSSWQRYLAGHTLPPWAAVRALCGLTKEPDERLRAFWELADIAWSRRSATQAPELAAPAVQPRPNSDTPGVPLVVPDPVLYEAAPAPASGYRGRLAMLSGVALVVALIFGLGLWFTVARQQDTADLRQPEPAAPTSTGSGVTCTGSACTGRDPGVTMCGVQPQTLLHVQTPAGFGLEIRYNPLCRAAWARTWNAGLGDVLTVSIPGEPAQAAIVSHGPGGDPFIYTPLIGVVARGSPLKACLISSQDHAVHCYSTAAPR